MNSYKYKEAEQIFTDGEYNFDLYKYALEKIFSEEAKEREAEEEKNRVNTPQTSILQTLTSAKSSFFITISLILFSVSMLGLHYWLSPSIPHSAHRQF